MSEPHTHASASPSLPATETVTSAHNIFQRAFLTTKLTIVSSLDGLGHRVLSTLTFPVFSSSFSASSGAGSAAERRLQSDIRLITVLSVALAASETGRALVLLRRQARKYGRERMGLLESAGHSLGKGARELRKMVSWVKSPNNSSEETPGPLPMSKRAEQRTNPLSVGNSDNDDDDDDRGVDGAALSSHNASSNTLFDSGDSQQQRQRTTTGVAAAAVTGAGGNANASGTAGALVVEGGDEEEDEAEEEDAGLASGEDIDIRTKTPLQLIHYWKQMEKAILTVSCRQPFGLPLQDRTCDVTDPQAKRRQKTLLTASAADGSASRACGVSVADAASSGNQADMPSPLTTTRPSDAPTTLVLPIEGCFLYERRPDVFDFAWREADEAEEQRIKQQEAEETRARRLGTEASSPKSKGNAEAAPVPRRPVLPPSASFRGLVRFDTAEFLQASPMPPSSPIRTSTNAPHRSGPNGQLLAAGGGATLTPPTLPSPLPHGRSGERSFGSASPDRSEHASSAPGDVSELSPLVHDEAWRPPLKWEALFLVWGLSVDYNITIREVRQLLLSASPPAFLTPAITHGDGPTAFDVSSANLSLLWFLANVRLIYAAIVVHGDIQKCSDEMEELDTYMSVMYKKCIARWPAPADMPATWRTARRRNNVWLVCAVQGSWQVLSAAYDELKAIRFQRSLSGVWQLAKYMYASSKTKYVSAVLIAALTALNSRILSAGRLVREEINVALSKATGETEVAEAHAGGGESDGSSVKPLGLGALCCYELGRLVLNYVLVRTTSEFIALTAGLRKDAVRAELYEALAHMPLGYFDVRTFEEVEGIIYSVDDLEGIDVQINQYVFGAVNTLWMLREALSDVHSGRVLLVAATTASLPHIVEYVGRRVKAWYDDLLRAGALPWLLNPANSRVAAEEEAFNTDGVLLRGTEIIGAVHQLRPYGADTRLTHWWNQCVQYEPSHPSQVRQHNSNASSAVNADCLRADMPPRRQSQGSAASPRNSNDGGTDAATRALLLAHRLTADVKESGHFLLDAVRQLMTMPYGKVIPGIGKGILDLSDWMLPIFLNALGARWCGLSPSETFRLLDCASAMESGVSVVVEGIEVAQMLLENGYKATMLERVLDATCWETTSAEEAHYLQNYVNTRDDTVAAGAGAGVAEVTWDEDGRGTSDPSTGMQSPSSAFPGSASPLPAASSHPGPISLAVGGASLAHPAAAAALANASTLDIRGASLYRHYLINRIHFRNVQFRYPSTPNVNAFGGKSLSVTLYLLNEPDAPPSRSTATSTAAHGSSAGAAAGGKEVRGRGGGGSARQTPSPTMKSAPAHRPRRRGRLVCITGPSGSGKSTLLSLLLALYTQYAKDAGDPRIEVELLRRGSRGRGAAAHRQSTWPSSLDVSRNPSCVCLAAGGAGSHSSGNVGGDAAARSASPLPAPYGRYHDSLPPSLTLDLRLLPVDVLRGRFFSYVPQTPTIFSGATIAQNISLAGFVSIATDDILQKVEHCAALACCGSFVQQLPAGLLTRVCDSSSGWCNPTGADGRSIVRLTPDQLQRIMIARALYHGGQILLMDEPTANLDAAVAACLQALWLSLLDDGTVKGIVCVTHDPALLAAADQVITLPGPA